MSCTPSSSTTHLPKWVVNVNDCHLMDEGRGVGKLVGIGSVERCQSTSSHGTRCCLQFKIPATDAVCVKVASSLTFCAHSSLQSFSTSAKMKGPKTGPLGGTTFDPKRVHFWVPSEIYLLCARVQNWALSILNPVPPWGACLTPHSNTLLRRVVGIRPQTSA